MKFKFCGDLDCPDWVLAEITNLSKMSSVKMKLLITQVIKCMLEGELNYDKVYKLTADAKFDLSDIKGSIATSHFILCNAAKYNMESDALCNELQQLGLPKEHATGLCRAYHDNVEKLRQVLQDTSLRLSKFKSCDWRVDYVMSSSVQQQVDQPEFHLKLNYTATDSNDEVKSAAFTTDREGLRELIRELKEARKVMESLH
ncbi:COMM domain-containing protein 4 [Trichoplax sp. H2]|uniref:COMM domain-containing protein n=1 Tax=Trichoplax adhaerens TaxID=10228 RepID=B3S867_TRIAD|nr:hypothetical protein TRIADDRAFT_30907 [Trichoplax adhaerens]EDV21144.1 hypothetical protein TRIADDRAFT_30907 [Trichoplax adhaerens]RDD45103.1 COMM domain-containing protein 4 [Trichoplax sp. H2]|eukprot:XP_002116474.1 hypothetical protein TRIADDRAFT_30907 [Trichoplax adhaerens]